MAGLWPGGEALTSLALYRLATLLSNKEKQTKNTSMRSYKMPEIFFSFF